MRIDAFGICRFMKYSSVGVSTFLFDLCLLYVFTAHLHINILISTAVAFLIAVSINHYISSRHVFSKSTTSHKRSYLQFVLVALTALVATIISMHLLVSEFELYPLLARTITSLLVGVASYLCNLYMNFRVAGIH